MSFYISPIPPSRRPTASGFSVSSYVPTLSSMAPASIYHQEYGTDDADDAGALYGQPSADLALTYRDTLLTPEMISTTKDTAGLDPLLGNSYSRLKSGASVRLSNPRVHTSTRSHAPLTVTNIPLEQAKTYARVELDMILANNTCVQGGSLCGHIKVCVRKDMKGEGPVWLAKGKMRIIGFECINNNEDRHTFYHYAVPLTSVTSSIDLLYNSSPDAEGYAMAKEGIHTLPFTLSLPLGDSYGMPRGVLRIQSKAVVRYIAMM